MQKNSLTPSLLLILAFILSGLSLWRCTPPNDAALLADQPLAAYWQIDQNNAEGWTVGDRIPLTLHITYEISIPAPETLISPADDRSEIVNQTTTKPQRGRGTRNIETLVEIVCWTPGDHASPSAAISFLDPDGQPQTLLVEPIPIQIKSVLSEEDTQKKDIKPQANLPRPPIWGWILVAVIAASMIYGLILWLLQRRKRASENTMDNDLPYDPRPPEEIALTELARIESLDLPSQDEFQHHYTLVSDCIRRYFEARFNIPAIDRTTNEFLHEINQATLNRPVLHSVSSLLNEADLVKFAKAIPTLSAARQLIQQARALIEIARPAPIDDEEGVSQ